ncbi:hypothetical protein D3C76_1828230 [compost metagenome]
MCKSQHTAHDGPAPSGHRHIALTGQFGEGGADVLKPDVGYRHFAEGRVDVVGQCTVETGERFLH